MALALSFVSVAAPGRVQAAVPEVGKIAMVDMQRVLNETRAGKRARKDLESASLAKQQKLDKRRKKLEADQARLQNLSGQQRAQAEENLQRAYYELQSMYMTLQQELMAEEQRLLEKLYKNCQGLVGKLAKDRGLDLVLIRDQATVLYTQSSIDITADVIKAYDKKFK